MSAATILGVASIAPLPLDPHEEGEAGAIDLLVDHSGRNKRLIAGDRRRGEREFGLVRRRHVDRGGHGSFRVRSNLLRRRNIGIFPHRNAPRAEHRRD